MSLMLLQLVALVSRNSNIPPPMVCAERRVDGGRFFGVSIMQVERLDIYDFKVTLDEKEFEVLGDISEHYKADILNTLIGLLRLGFMKAEQSLE